MAANDNIEDLSFDISQRRDGIKRCGLIHGSLETRLVSLPGCPNLRLRVSWGPKTFKSTSSATAVRGCFAPNLMTCRAAPRVSELIETSFFLISKQRQNSEAYPGWLLFWVELPMIGIVDQGARKAAVTLALPIVVDESSCSCRS